MTFWSSRRNGLIIKIRLISKFMTSQADYEVFTVDILPNIARSKGNHTTKLDQLIEYFSSKVIQKMKLGD